MYDKKISTLSKMLLLLAAGLLFSSIFFPLWRIELDAPQYPEGLVLQLFADKIGGDVEIINGLNHYIGMKTLHTEDFFEFSIIKYILILFAVLAIITLMLAKKRVLYGVLVLFILFAIIAGLDFYRWNYEYGHNLDPNAAIKVPGMAYQPPILGYKKLLNFGAYSIPDKGGWLLLGAGLLLLLSAIKERSLTIRLKKNKQKSALLLFTAIAVYSCSTSGPEPIKLNAESCAFCKMTIADGRFGAEVRTQKGRYYKFDDLSCMTRYVNHNSGVHYKDYYVHDYLGNNQLIPVESAFFISGGKIISPMQGNVAAFSTKESASEYSEKLEASLTTWEVLLNSFK